MMPARARNTDPVESHAAAERMNRSGKALAQRDAARALVRAYPGLPATKLAEAFLPGTESLGRDSVTRRYALARRLPECPELRAKSQDGQRERVWWPA